MKFIEWMKIREQTTAIVPKTPGAPGAPGLNQPGEAAKKQKTKTAIGTTLAGVVGKPPKVQVAALQAAAKKLALDKNADDQAVQDIDDQVKQIQARAGIKV